MTVFNEFSVIQRWEDKAQRLLPARVHFFHNTLGEADQRLMETLNWLTFFNTGQLDRDGLFLKGN